MRNSFRSIILAVAFVAAALLASTTAFGQMEDVANPPKPEQFVSGGVKPQVDACPNLEGVQVAVPEGMTLVDGKCVAPPSSGLNWGWIVLGLLMLGAGIAVYVNRAQIFGGHDNDTPGPRPVPGGPAHHIIGMLLIPTLALGFLAMPADAATATKIEPYKVQTGSTLDVVVTGTGFGSDLAKVGVAFSSDAAKGHPDLGVVIKSVTPTKITSSVSVPSGAKDSFRKFWLRINGAEVRNALTLWVVQPAVSSSLDAGDRRFAQREAVTAVVGQAKAAGDAASNAAREAQAASERAVQARQRADSAVAAGDKLLRLHDALDGRLSDHERRITALESRPSAKVADLGPLASRVSALEEDNKKLSEELDRAKALAVGAGNLASHAVALGDHNGARPIIGGGGPSKANRQSAKDAVEGWKILSGQVPNEGSTTKQ